MKHPLISIIVPAYNVEEYIEAAINSCLTQITKYNYEIIICDDASTDSTNKLVNFLYKDHSNIKLITNKKNQGVGFARNIAIKHAKGRYIFLQDADDYIHPETIQIFATILELRNDIDTVFSDYVYVDNKDQKSERINAKIRPIACSKMLRKNIFAKYGLYENLRVGEEKEFEKRLDNSGVAKFHLELPLYRYRQHNMTITADYENKRAYDCNKSEF